MRTGPNLTDLNNRMILWEYERALLRRNQTLATKIRKSNPQILRMEFDLIAWELIYRLVWRHC